MYSFDALFGFLSTTSMSASSFQFKIFLEQIQKQLEKSTHKLYTKSCLGR